MLTVFIGLILGTKKSKDRRTPTGLGNSYWGSAGSAFGTYLPLQSPSVAPTATRLFAMGREGGGSRKQEMRDCKGIKILLGICLSSYRNEDLLP